MNISGSKSYALLALAAICIIWGTTYTYIKIAVYYFPPFLMACTRQTAAGLLLLGYFSLKGHQIKFSDLSRGYIARQCLTGLLTITGGNGFITWSMQYVSSGLASVIGALSPVFIAIITTLWKGDEKLSWVDYVGILLGFSGLGLIFSHGWADFANPQYRLGIIGCFTSCLSWSLGAVMSKRWNRPDYPTFLNAGLQITSGGLGLLVCSLLFDTSHTIHHSWAGWTALLYLILVGSALAFTLYMYCLKHLSTTTTSLYTYINPVVAIFLGWFFLKEPLTIWMFFGMCLTLCGVYLVGVSEHKKLTR